MEADGGDIGIRLAARKSAIGATRRTGSPAYRGRSNYIPEDPNWVQPWWRQQAAPPSTPSECVWSVCVLAAILLADDDEVFRAVICRCLRAAGHTVEEAADGKEALKFLAAKTPDIIITDILMPNTDGIELTSAVKRGHPGVRVLAISGRRQLGSVDLLHLASMLGADATLSKPFAPEQLLEMVAALEGARTDPA